MLRATPRARSTSSWRRRSRGHGWPAAATPKPPSRSSSPAAPRDGIAVARYELSIDSLATFRKYLLCAEGTRSADADALVMELTSGASQRRVPLLIFLEGVDVALRDMEREARDVANGLAEFSVHQPSLANVVDIARKYCAKLRIMGQLRRIVVRHQDCGFFGAFLSAMDVLLMAPAEVEVAIDWTLKGNEEHFTYEPPREGECVWRALFDPVRKRGRAPHGAPAAPDHDVQMNQRFNFMLSARFRWLWRRSPRFQAQRAAYHAVYATHVRLRHPLLASLMAPGGLGAELRAGVSIGVHKRVDTVCRRRHAAAPAVQPCNCATTQPPGTAAGAVWERWLATERGGRGRGREGSIEGRQQRGERRQASCHHVGPPSCPSRGSPILPVL